MVSMPPASGIEEARPPQEGALRSKEWCARIGRTSAHFGGPRGPETGGDLPTDTQQVGGAVEGWTIR